MIPMLPACSYASQRRSATCAAALRVNRMPAALRGCGDFGRATFQLLQRARPKLFFCVSFGSEGIPHGAYGQKSLNTTAKVDGVCRWLARAPSSQGLADHVGSCEGTLRFISLFIHDGSIANSKIRFCHRSTRAHNAESSCQRPLTTSDMVSQALGTWSPRKPTANAVNFLGGV